jgi:hypothetical protein
LTATIDRTDIITALRVAGIEYTITHPRTLNEAFVVAHPDGREVAFGPGEDGHGNQIGEGVNIAYYREDTDTDVTSSDWLASVDELISALRSFLADTIDGWLSRLDKVTARHETPTDAVSHACSSGEFGGYGLATDDPHWDDERLVIVVDNGWTAIWDTDQQMWMSVA